MILHRFCFERGRFKLGFSFYVRKCRTSLNSCFLCGWHLVLRARAKGSLLNCPLRRLLIRSSQAWIILLRTRLTLTHLTCDLDSQLRRLSLTLCVRGQLSSPGVEEKCLWWQAVRLLWEANLPGNYLSVKARESLSPHESDVYLYPQRQLYRVNHLFISKFLSTFKGGP